VLEVIKVVANWGFPAVLCIYLLSILPKFGKKLDELSNNIENHLTTALKENTEATKKDSESGGRIEKAMDKVSNSMDKLSSNIIEFINRK